MEVALSHWRQQGALFYLAPAVPCWSPDLLSPTRGCPACKSKRSKHQSRLCEYHPGNVPFFSQLVIRSGHMSKLASWAGKCVPHPLTSVRSSSLAVVLPGKLPLLARCDAVFILRGANPAAHLPPVASVGFCLLRNQDDFYVNKTNDLKLQGVFLGCLNRQGQFVLKREYYFSTVYPRPFFFFFF